MGIDETHNREVNHPSGELCSKRKTDTNLTIPIIPDNNKRKDKIILYFSLMNVVQPNKIYSFSISIINNVKLGIETYLGDLENRTGNNIEFGNSFSIDYFFQRKQCLIFEPKIYGNNIGIKKYLTLSDLIRSPGNKITINFEGIGLLLINFKIEKIKEIPPEKRISSFQITFNLRNNIFKNYNSNIFFVLYNNDCGNKRLIYKSQEFSKINNFMQSNIITLSSELLSPNNNKSSPIYLHFFCLPLNPKMPIGEAIFNLQILENNLQNDKLSNFPLNSNKYNNLGSIQINYDESVKLTFIDYISKGMQINLEIAIDYTASNNENPIPLHSLDYRYPNDYEKAIQSCGTIIAYYDFDQLFPVYGFGGIPKIPGYPANIVSHCFNINFQNDPNIRGINNIIETYRQSLSKIELAAPTYFTPILNKVISEIKNDLENKQEENHYYVLLILTDGSINDMQETCDKIVEASYLPLSIIIVGIGNADFSLMKILDGDKYPLKNSRGELRKRDIVQFVKFEDFKKNNAIDYGTDLTEEVLKEIPTQVEEYYEKCGKFY